MRLYWIRHGPTHATGMTGWTDRPTDLSDRAALTRLEARLPAAPIVSSDLTRAIQTADAIAGGRPRLAPDPALREMHFGTWEGRTHDNIAAGDPALARAFWEAPGSVAPPGGESWDDLRARVDPVADRLAARDTIVVAHFGVILGQVQRARGITPAEALSQPIPPLSLTILHRQAEGWHAEEVAWRPTHHDP